ncbi:MAG: hypothetical protein JNL97_12320, partial [Verrucomicrobiales bacterium]|nr:hypothetical protein [Verrucomicrobiales bacterium]
MTVLAAWISAGHAESRSEALPDWPRWRGLHDLGSASRGNYPDRLAPERAAWKTPLPGKGCSTPIVWKDALYLTAPVEGNDAAMSFDRHGKLRWQ